MKNIILREPRDFGDVITDTFGYVRIHFKSLSKILLLLCLPIILISGALLSMGFGDVMNQAQFGGAPSGLLGFGLQFLLGLLFLMTAIVIITIVIFRHVKSIDEGYSPNELGFGYFFENIGRNILGLIGIYFLFTIPHSIITGIIASMGDPAALVAGMFIYMLVAAFIYIKLSLASVIFVIEEEGVFASVLRSWELTHGYWWFTFGVLFVIGLIIYLGAIALAIPISVLTSFLSFSTDLQDAGNIGSTVGIVYGFMMTILSLLYCFPIIAQALTYFTLSEKKGGQSLLNKIDSLGSD